MKIYNVTFDDGGWHSGPRPNFMIVADSKEEAIEKALKDNPLYSKGYSKWASEFKIDGYVIEVYDKTSYNRDKNIKKLIE